MSFPLRDEKGWGVAEVQRDKAPVEWAQSESTVAMETDTTVRPFVWTKVRSQRRREKRKQGDKGLREWKKGWRGADQETTLHRANCERYVSAQWRAKAHPCVRALYVLYTLTFVNQRLTTKLVKGLRSRYLCSKTYFDFFFSGRFMPLWLQRVITGYWITIKTSRDQKWSRIWRYDWMESSQLTSPDHWNKATSIPGSLSKGRGERQRREREITRF